MKRIFLMAGLLSFITGFFSLSASAADYKMAEAYPCGLKAATPRNGQKLLHKNSSALNTNIMLQICLFQAVQVVPLLLHTTPMRQKMSKSAGNLQLKSNI